MIEIITIVGFVVTVGGFAISIWQIRAAKKAAFQAKEIAEEVRRDINNLDLVSEFASAIGIMNEIKRLHRLEYWPILPERYATLRERLIHIRAMCKQLSEDNLKKIQGAIQLSASLENDVELFNARKATTAPDIVRSNKDISKRIDELQRVLLIVKDSIGR